MQSHVYTHTHISGKRAVPGEVASTVPALDKCGEEKFMNNERKQKKREVNLVFMADVYWPSHESFSF